MLEQKLAKKAMKEPNKTVKELVQARYHGYLDMFKKLKAQCLLPKCMYEFQGELIPRAQPQKRGVNLVFWLGKILSTR